MKHKTDYCPNCKKLIDAQTSAQGNHRPSPGDITICLYYKTILVFKDNLLTRLPTSDEINNLKVDSDIWRQITTVIGAIKIASQYPD